MSDNLRTDKLWLIGAGPMAVDYANVLKALNIPFEVIGRGKSSAESFRQKTGLFVHQGGLKSVLKKSGKAPEGAIVAVSVEQLAEATIELLKKGTKRILLEKPGGLDSAQVRQVWEETKKTGADIFIAYNRRFYSSVLKALEIIKADGGVTSFHFEFTEWSHQIVGLPKPKEVKENWLLANSSHVIDLAFFLGGRPRELSSYSVGGLSWHPTASVFAGAGISERGALFSYHANWEAPGRWSVEALTRKHRLIFRPMEQLHVQRIGSVVIEKLEIDDQFDKNFKPGLYLQVEAFIHSKSDLLLGLSEHITLLDCYDLVHRGKKTLD